jgi:probable rRNA maturation factor
MKTDSAPHGPSIALYPHGGAEGLDLAWIEATAARALPLCLAERGPGEAPLAELGEIEVSLLDDEAIARVHGEFMDDPSATDVITFQHGELLVSAETARREAPEHGNSPEAETLLYIVHGLLHLNGHGDLAEPERTAMHRAQDAILARLLGEAPGHSTS